MNRKMVNKLTNYGFHSKGVAEHGYQKNGWHFEYWKDSSSCWVFNPKCNKREGLVIKAESEENVIALVEFISKYKGAE